LGGTWESISRRTPVGVVMQLFAPALHVSAWNRNDTLFLLACFGYIVACGTVGIRLVPVGIPMSASSS
jgi:hypothetical protein